jgi:hypothetical protein
MLGLQIEITESPFVVHQWHYSNPGNPLHAELCAKNSLLLPQLVAENDYRAKHLITPDL